MQKWCEIGFNLLALCQVDKYCRIVCIEFMTVDNSILLLIYVPHLLWHGTIVYNGHLRRPVTLTPVVERLSVELSLHVLMTQVCHGRDLHTRLTLTVSVSDFIKILSDLIGYQKLFVAWQPRDTQLNPDPPEIVCQLHKKRPTGCKGHLNSRNCTLTDCPKSIWIINFAILFDNFNEQIGHTLAQEPLLRGPEFYKFHWLFLAYHF